MQIHCLLKYLKKIACKNLFHINSVRKIKDNFYFWVKNMDQLYLIGVEIKSQGI